MINGILPIYKEATYTSFDVVAILRKKLGIKKIGHTGTLDPYAIGVLPVCLGSSTKLVSHLTDNVKEYVASFCFGIKTDTADILGKVLKKEDKSFCEEDLKNVISSFRGEYMQVPPMYSALKHKGKKLYEYARAGINIERQARKVYIYDISLISKENIDYKIEEMPKKEDFSYKNYYLKVSCSKGTYIRTLIEDVAEKLNMCATMTGLIRTKSGGISLADCVKLEDLSSTVIENKLIKPENVFKEYEKIYLDEEGSRYLLNGNKLNLSYAKSDDALFLVYDNNKNFKAVYERGENALKPKYMFLDKEGEDV